MPSFSFCVFVVLDFTLEKQLFFFYSVPNWAHFVAFWGSNSSKQYQIDLNFWPQLLLIIAHIPGKIFWKTWILRRQEVPNFWIFDPTLTLICPINIAEVKKSKYLLEKKTYALGYLNQSKFKPYLLSIFDKNNNYILLCLGFFWVQMRPRSEIERSQLRLASLFPKPC